MIGKLFNNRYRIVEKLGAGGTAIVYRGQDLLLHRSVTIKILREEYANNQEFVRRFNHEAQAVASLSHNNIVGVYDVGTEENLHYIVMEFVEGESLKDYINRKGALPINEACNIICQILAGVQHAHEHGIIHRDIKPHNILLGKDGRAKVTDFGIAIGLSDVTLTYNTTSRIMGSVHYISPEQVQGLTVTERSDIYSVGVMFYEMLTGRLPYVGETPISIAMQHVQGELVLPHQINPAVPDSLSYVVMRAMRKNPETRYPSALSMAQAVRGAYQEYLRSQQPPEESSTDIVVTPGKAVKTTKKTAKEAVATDPIEPPTELPPKKGDQLVRLGKFQLPRKQRTLVLITAAVVLLALLWVLGQLFGFLQFREQKAVVPQFVGMLEEQARTAAEDAGLELDISYRSNAETPEGTVMTQNVLAEQQVTPGRVIELVVSSGPEKVKLTDLSGVSQRIAELTLNNLGLVSNITTEYNEEVAKGLVIMQSPAEGTELAPGSTVTLLVSLGAEPLKFSMSSLKGYTLEDAQAYAADNGLVVSAVNYADSDVYSYGQVVEQSLAAGTTVQTGDELTLTVSQGPGPTELIYTLRYLLPPSGDELRTVVITVKDAQGSRDVYTQEQKGGNYLSYDVKYYNYATIEVKIDGEVVFSQAV